MTKHRNVKETTLNRFRRNGDERARIYWVLAVTGLRENEIRTLVWDDLRLATDPPTMRVNARHAKNKHETVTPLNPGLAQMLQEWWRQRNLEYLHEARAIREKGEKPKRLCDTPVFRVPQHLIRHFRKDCEAAGINMDESQGRVDVHALRHTFRMLIRHAGAELEEAQLLMRHRDSRHETVPYPVVT